MRAEGDKRVVLKQRTTKFALDAIRLFERLPKSVVASVLGRQLLRSATSVGAHYREAQRAKSDADFVSKIEGALQELDETSYWLELLSESGQVSGTQVAQLKDETEQLLSIFVAIAKSAKSRSPRKR